MTFSNQRLKEAAKKLAKAQADKYSAKATAVSAGAVGSAFVAINGGLAPATLPDGVTGEIAVVNSGRLANAKYSTQAGVSTVITTRSTSGSTGTTGGVTDHGSLTGLNDDDHTQYLLADGTRTVNGTLSVTGNISVTGNVDGVDISAHAANANAHHAPVTAGSGISLSGQQVSLASTSAGNGLTYASGVLNVGAGSGISVAADSVAANIDTARGVQFVSGAIAVNLDANSGMLFSGAGALALGTPSNITVSTTNTVTGSSHSHAVVSSNNPGPSSAILASTTGGGLTLVTLTATTSVTTPLLSSSGDLTIDPSGNVYFPNAQTVRSVTFNSGLTIQGWQINEVTSGTSALTIGTISVDELRAKVFVADEVRVDRGEQVWGKSFGVVESDFTTPASVGGDGVSVWFENSPAIAGAIFTTGDWIRMRIFDRSSGFTIANVWGQVYSTSSGAVPGYSLDTPNNRQRWRFVLRQGTTSYEIKKGNTAIDYGQSGQPYIFLSAVDPAGAPYIKFNVWSGSDPYTAGNHTTGVVIGHLKSVFGVNNEYGLAAGNGFTSSDSYIRYSSSIVKQNNVDSIYTSGGTSFLTIDSTDGVEITLPSGGGTRQRAFSFATSGGTEIGGVYAYSGTSPTRNEVYVAANQAGANNYVSTAAVTSSTSYGARNIVSATSSSHAAYVQLDASTSSVIDISTELLQIASDEFSLDTNGSLWTSGIVEGGYGALSGNLSQATFRYSTAAAISLASTVWGYASHIGFNAYMADRSASYDASGAWEYVGAQYTGNSTAPGRLTWDGNANAFYFAIGETGLATGDPITSWTTALSVSANSMDWRANTDNTATFGRAKIGYLGYSDHAGFAHYDMASAGNYALLQNPTGVTFLNSASGQRTRFRINNVAVGNLGATGLRVGDDSSATEMLDVVGNATISGSLDAASFAANWTTLSYNTNWSSYGGAYGAVKYCRIGDWVIVNGMAKRSAGSAVATIATLPSGYRPTVQKSWYTTFSVGSVESAAKIEVTTSGTIAVTAGGTSAIDYVSLDCIQFRTNS